MASNEKKLQEIFQKLGKSKTFRLADNTIKTSIDFTLVENNKTYYIEVDSYNMAKCVLGQYVLLNQTDKIDKKNSIFVVIHFYNGYDPERTINHLNLAKNKLNCTLPFAVFHIDNLKDKVHSLKEFSELVNLQLQSKQ
jgi:hypothetical protein